MVLATWGFVTSVRCLSFRRDYAGGVAQPKPSVARSAGLRWVSPGFICAYPGRVAQELCPPVQTGSIPHVPFIAFDTYLAAPAEFI